jgi:hypothetical protein
MRSAFSAFIECNPSSVENTKAVIVDKDFTEIAVISEMLPNARVLLCQFHVLAYVRKQTVMMFRGDGGLRQMVDDTFSLMVYSYSLNEYEEARLFLLHLLKGVSLCEPMCCM